MPGCLEDYFDLLPPEDRRRILQLLHRALMDRSGGGVLRDLIRQERLIEIADILAANRHEVPEHT